MYIFSYLFITPSNHLNNLSIMLSINVIEYNVIFELKAKPNAIAIEGNNANLHINRYIKLTQNIIQKEQPNGAFSSTCLILPFVSNAVSKPAIVLGKFSISHTYTIMKLISIKLIIIVYFVSCVIVCKYIVCYIRIV